MFLLSLFLFLCFPSFCKLSALSDCMNTYKEEISRHQETLNNLKMLNESYFNLLENYDELRIIQEETLKEIKIKGLNIEKIQKDFDNHKETHNKVVNLNNKLQKMIKRIKIYDFELDIHDLYMILFILTPIFYLILNIYIINLLIKFMCTSKNIIVIEDKKEENIIKTTTKEINEKQSRYVFLIMIIIIGINILGFYLLFYTSTLSSIIYYDDGYF